MAGTSHTLWQLGERQEENLNFTLSPAAHSLFIQRVPQEAGNSVTSVTNKLSSLYSTEIATIPYFNTFTELAVSTETTLSVFSRRVRLAR